jgi:hypothetical protein
MCRREITRERERERERDRERERQKEKERGNMILKQIRADF